MNLYSFFAFWGESGKQLIFLNILKSSLSDKKSLGGLSYPILRELPNSKWVILFVDLLLSGENRLSICTDPLLVLAAGCL